MFIETQEISEKRIVASQSFTFQIGNTSQQHVARQPTTFSFRKIHDSPISNFAMSVQETEAIDTQEVRHSSNEYNLFNEFIRAVLLGLCCILSTFVVVSFILGKNFVQWISAQSSSVILLSQRSEPRSTSKGSNKNILVTLAIGILIGFVSKMIPLHETFTAADTNTFASLEASTDALNLGTYEMQHYIFE